MKEQFDFESYQKQAVEDLLSDKKQIVGPDGVLAPLLKQFLETALEVEVKSHVPHSTLRIPHSAFRIPHSALPFVEPFQPIV